jgi:hypothetical protein
MAALVILVLYLVIGAITGGIIHALKSDEYHWDTEASFGVGAAWPFSLVWYWFLKPIAKLTIHLTNRLIARVRTRKRDRERAKELQERERQYRIAEGMPAVEQFMAEPEESYRNPTRYIG